MKCTRLKRNTQVVKMKSLRVITRVLIINNAHFYFRLFLASTDKCSFQTCNLRCVEE